ncbi:MAG TPA: HD domain-containing protein [Lacipirellulaceae bacterium]|nr:HD domain-containing protein [Lacipirellulaceae bacterium]
MNTIHDIPEVGRARNAGGLVRIPPGVDVPLTARVRRLIDTASFRRLAQISQLGLVSLVYPAANHSRQEHSLGVFLAAIEYLDRLAGDERFTASVLPKDAECFLAAALLHDVGHCPFGHPIEDLHLPKIVPHEERARGRIESSEVADVLRDEWGLDPANVSALVAGDVDGRPRSILRSLLSGPIDVDKVDYLMRDSLHAGVPYGRNFDRRRLTGSLCLNEAGDGLAITDKGKTAAEMLVFARYVMFSEVYWHHAVRSATAMFQRAIFMLHEELDLEPVLVPLTDTRLIDTLRHLSRKDPTTIFGLLDGIFGPTRRLYKRLAQYSYFEQPEIYRRLARRPYPDLVAIAKRIAAELSGPLGTAVSPHEVLVDAPPAELEVDFDIEVFYPKERVYRRLGDVSPVVRTLAKEQFDDYVKRVRIFVHPRIAAEAARLPDLANRLAATIEAEAPRS